MLKSDNDRVSLNVSIVVPAPHHDSLVLQSGLPELRELLSQAASPLSFFALQNLKTSTIPTTPKKGNAQQIANLLRHRCPRVRIAVAWRHDSHYADSFRPTFPWLPPQPCVEQLTSSTLYTCVNSVCAAHWLVGTAHCQPKKYHPVLKTPT